MFQAVIFPAVMSLALMFPALMSQALMFPALMSLAVMSLAVMFQAVMFPVVTIILADIEIEHSNLTSPSIANTPFLMSFSTSLCVRYIFIMF
jgi:uncharacterized membrane protein YhdT